MRTKVSEQGVSIPKEFFVGVEEVEIRQDDKIVFVIPVAPDGSVVQLGIQLSEDDIRITRREIIDINETMLSNARLVRFEYYSKEILHNYKNKLMNISRALQESLSSSPRMSIIVIERALQSISQWTEEIAIELHTISSSYERVNINKVIQRVVRYFSFEKENNLNFSCQYLDDIPDIEANEAQMNEIFMNLISNAIKSIHTIGSNRGNITVVTDIVTLNRIQFIQIKIEDDGIGISNNNKEKIFERGFSTYKNGTGMGLYLTREILNTYGGKIFLDSTIDKGSRFIIQLPLKRLIYQEESSGNESNL